MGITIKISKKQAKKIAERLFFGNFSLAGVGWFNLTADQTAEAIMTAINDNDKKMLEYYNKINPLR